MVMEPSYFRLCGTLSPGEQVQLLAFVATCATAFIACPRSRLHHKALTLACYTLSAVLVIGGGARYFVGPLLDLATVHLAHVYQWGNVGPATPGCGS